MKIYISGIITGKEYLEVFKDFELAEKYLLKIGCFNIVNPTLLPHNHDKQWSSYMKEDIAELLKCDAIYMLKDWEKGNGTLVEFYLAQKLGLEIIFEK